MKHVVHKWVVCLLPIFFVSLSSCRDTPERAFEDLKELMEETVDVLEDFDKGKISSSEATEALKGTGSKVEAILDRFRQFRKDGEMDKEEEDRLHSKYEAEITGLMERVGNLRKKLKRSGKWTPKFEEAFNQ